MTFLKNIFLFFLLFTSTLSSCEPAEKSSQNQGNRTFQEQNKGDSTEKRSKKYRKRHKRERNGDKNSKYASENRVDKNASDILPEKALKVLKYVRENGVAMSGYVGGRRFGNYEGLLPKKDKSGKRIEYQEWDVNPKIQGKNRGTERLITGSDGKGYYTDDHYESFVLVE